MKLEQFYKEPSVNWRALEIDIPMFDRQAMRQATQETPHWVHFGIGNIFRGYIADLQQTLLNCSKAETGIVAVESFDGEIVEKISKPYDDLTLLTVMNADGTFEKRIIASIAQSICLTEEGRQTLQEIFCTQSLQMVSFTITEKGYTLYDMNGELFGFVQDDLQNNPAKAKTAMGIVCAMLLARYKAGAQPIAMVSMDNCSNNGDKLRSSLLTIAKAWVENGFAEEGFCRYLTDKDKVGFPLSMIDKITPNPSTAVQTVLTSLGLENMQIIRTQKGACMAPFVNAEKAQYLVIEDWFPNGRPLLEQAGVYITQRETVERMEKMKVCTCLNPLHTALAIFGCLLGFESISSEMKDADLKTLVNRIGYDEGMPVVVNPEIIQPETFLYVVLNERLPNPNVPDTPQRIASDTSQKIGIRFGETIKAYVENPALDASSLRLIALVLAAWCRYLLEKDDNGKPMQCSQDPMLAELSALLSGVQLGQTCDVHKTLSPILKNEKIFGIDLYKAGLGETIETDFAAMIEGPGAVRKTLQKALS